MEDEDGIDGPFNKAMDAPVWEKGCQVQVRAFGCWYPGKVVSVGSRLVKVAFTTGSATTKTRAFPPCCVVPDRTFVVFRRGEPGPGSDDAKLAIERRRAITAAHAGAVSR